MATGESTKLQKSSSVLPANVLSDRVVQRLMEAEKALGHAVTVDQVKLVMDAAAAQQVFAQRQKLGEDVIGYAHTIKIRALGRLGELLIQARKSDELHKGGRPRKTNSEGEFVSKPTNADIGVDAKTSMIAQQLAALPAGMREAIEQREVSLTEANRQQKRQHQPQILEIPKGRFRVLYADPPWSYGNSGIIGDTDNYGRAERHYPSMTIAQLCDMDVKSRAADDAVLFLWVTSPLLDECWPVIKAWGFIYKTSMVWDKVKHNYGSYVSVRHELLLICTRGSCLPDRPTPMPDSVISIDRSESHSEKPAEFRAVIDHLYTGGADQKLELFGRAAVPGWTVYGNELLQREVTAG